MPTPRCTWSDGCRRRTTHASGRCHDHRMTAAPPVAPSDGAASVDHPEAEQGLWPAVVDDAPRVFTNATAPRRERRVTYRPAVPPLIAVRSPQLSAATEVLAREAARVLRTADADLTGPAAIPLLRSESSASSKVEHIDVEQRDIARALAGLPVRQRAAVEVANNLNAVQRALSNAHEDLTTDTIRAIHRALLPDERFAGRIRTTQNWIGGSDHSPHRARHIPPDPLRVDSLLTDLLAFMSRTDVDPVAHAAITHAQYETIHPFEDGNGRTGRALTHLLLRRHGVTVNGVAPLSIAFLGRADDYLDALRTYEDGDIDGYVLHFAEACMTAARATRALSEELDLQLQEWRENAAVAGARADSVIHRIVPDLISRPVTDAATTAQRHGVARQTAAAALAELEQAGILNRTTAARNHQVFEATAVFTAIEGVEQMVVDGELV